jgi:aryl carrier-like protein
MVVSGRTPQGLMALAGAAHRFRKDEDLDRHQRAIGLRPRADADEAALLDVRRRRLDDAADRVTRGERNLGLGPLHRLDRQGTTVDFFDLAANAGLRSLRISETWKRKANDEQGSGEGAHREYP